MEQRVIHYLPQEARGIPHEVGDEANPETTTEFSRVTCPACREAMSAVFGEVADGLDGMFRRLGTPDAGR